ncbi:transcriptional regulator [Paenibacillus sp. PK3_47]|uniref:tetratricopeptide repeat protein n=1 Tax=Paenibacillus sp. PK3_47 TaxID=2072642 RepID=UPI00201D2FBB|nr:transcriptional regulator [Paenibacillus sp. PK3_47]UQZ35974.1 transcriptional regulator [Paenibacillus sp. PK3_47]
MNATTTIRSELDDLMKQKGWNMSSVGRSSGLNVGSISSILKGNKVMSIDQVDRLTAVLSMPEGYYYEHYIQESMVEATPNWRRISPFLYRCAEIGRLDCIRRAVALLLEELSYAAVLYELANDFFTKKMNAAAAILYENIAECEIRQHSERLAFCQYRLFTLALGKDHIHNFKAACQFEPFIDRLNEFDQLDALKDLANIYRSLHRWDKVEELACRMETSAKLQYFTDSHDSSSKDAPHRTNSPLFVYIAYSYLLLANVCDARRNYQQALEYTCHCSDLSWVKETDPETLYWITVYRRWAQAGTYMTRLMSGDQSVLPDYIEFIESRQEVEIYDMLLNIIEAANRFQMDVDDILQKFEPELLLLKQEQNPEYSAQLWYQLSKYYLGRGRHLAGLEYLLECMVQASSINKSSMIVKCVGLFESFKEYALPDTLIQYQTIIKRVWEHNEQDNSTIEC